MNVTEKFQFLTSGKKGKKNVERKTVDGKARVRRSRRVWTHEYELINFSSRRISMWIEGEIMLSTC